MPRLRPPGEATACLHLRPRDQVYLASVVVVVPRHVVRLPRRPVARASLAGALTPIQALHAHVIHSGPMIHARREINLCSSPPAHLRRHHC